MEGTFLKTETVVEAEVIIIGGGLAGLSAAIYLGRARRDAIIIDEGKSMARWEPDVQNYLGFPKGVGGPDLVAKGVRQAKRYGTQFFKDRALKAQQADGGFVVSGNKRTYSSRRLLLATGIFHIPPDLPGVEPCLGHSMFFCKDCDGYRLHGKPVAIYGWNDDAVEYALGMLLYTPCVVIVTDGRPPSWSAQHTTWAREYRLPVHTERIVRVSRRGHQLRGLVFGTGEEVCVRALFTVRGDIYYNELASSLGAELDSEGEVVIDLACRTSVPGLYAAGCVTPANCQMIIAAGHGAIAAQAINRDLFEESLATHTLRTYRHRQLRRQRTRPHRRKTDKNASVPKPPVLA